MNDVFLSVIIIEYNSLDEIATFSNIMNKEFGERIELIVSSNSLYPELMQERLRRQFPFFNWVFNEKNGGFAYGMNAGLRVAKGDFLVVMNPDVKMKTSLMPMIDYLNIHKEVGIIAPKIVDEKNITQDSFRCFFSPWGLFMRQLGWLKDRGEFHMKDLIEPTSGDWVIGAFMMVRRDFYEKVGGLSEDYFMYCEDTDWCKRAHLAGYKVVYFPQTVVEYKGTRASRKSWKYAVIHIKSLLTFWRKYGFS